MSTLPAIWHFILNASQLIKLERCQQWFLKNIFYVPVFAPSSLLLKLSGLNSIKAEIDLKKLMFLGRLITGPKMAPAVRSLFSSRLNANITSQGVLATTHICRRKGCGSVGCPPPPPIIFQRLKLPPKIIYLRKENLSESPNHKKYWENILVSRFYEQFSRNRRNLGHFRILLFCKYVYL